MWYEHVLQHNSATEPPTIIVLAALPAESTAEQCIRIHSAHIHFFLLTRIELLQIYNKIDLMGTTLNQGKSHRKEQSKMISTGFNRKA